MYTLKRFAYGLATWAVFSYVMLCSAVAVDILTKIGNSTAIVDGQFRLWIDVAIIAPALLFGVFVTGDYMIG